VTKRDKKILKDIDLPTAKIAQLLGVERQAVHKGVDNKNNDYFNLTRLTTLAKKAETSTLIKDDPYLNAVYKKNIKKILFRELSKDLEIPLQDLQQVIHSALSFCHQGMGAWWWADAPASAETLADLLRPGGTFSELTIGVDAAMTAAAIATLETWAYELDGNFSDPLKVHLVELASPPFAAMIGAFQDSEFRGFIDSGEGFVPLDHPAFAEFPELNENLAALARLDLAAGDTLRWSLPVTPEARIIELLLRDSEESEESLPAAALDHLREWQAQFDAGGVEPDSRTAWQRVFRALPTPVLQDRFGIETALQIEDALVRLKLVRC
jgi:hypothetical protein